MNILIFYALLMLGYAKKTIQFLLIKIGYKIFSLHQSIIMFNVFNYIPILLKLYFMMYFGTSNAIGITNFNIINRGQNGCTSNSVIFTFIPLDNTFQCFILFMIIHRKRFQTCVIVQAIYVILGFLGQVNKVGFQITTRI